MRILFLAHRIPYPPNKGDKIRSYHALRALVDRGHEVHLRAFADDRADLRYQAELESFCASVEILPLSRWRAKLGALAKLPFSQSLSIGYYGAAGMRRSVDRIVRENHFDAVFVFSSTMSQYVPAGLHARTVADLVDMDSEKWRMAAAKVSWPMSWAYRVDWKRLRRYEHQIVRRFAYTILTTPREAALLDQIDEFTKRARVRTITNGVDLDLFQPGGKMSASPMIVFVGAMDYFANVDGVRWFVEKIFPLIRAEEPTAEFFIVGSNPTGEVVRLSTQPGVRVTGFVKDVRPYLANATVCVAPLQLARGIQNKVLEAMASGKALVATREAAGGLRVVPEEHLLIADAPESFAEAVLSLIRDERLRQYLERQARSYVEREHDWAPLLQKLADLVETAGVGRREPEHFPGRAISSL